MKELEFLKSRGYIPHSDLNYCTENGFEYYIGTDALRNKAAVAIFMPDDETMPERFVIPKECLREMSETAMTYGIKVVTLYTNYGCEVKKSEGTKSVGFTFIKKTLSNEWV